jgi:hypothetical protein
MIMRKFIFLAVLTYNGYVKGQSAEETKTVDQIIAAFTSVDDMILTAERLEQLYTDLSDLNYNHSVLLSLSAYGVIETANIYGDNQLLPSSEFLKDAMESLIRVSIDSSNLTSETRHHSNTQIGISVCFRKGGGNLIRTNLNIHMRSGVIVWIDEMTGIPVAEL